MATTLNHKRKRDPVDAGLGAYILRTMAVLFAMMLLICLPMLFMLMTLAPSQFDLFELLTGPIGHLLKVLAVVILLFIIWFGVAVIRNAKA